MGGGSKMSNIPCGYILLSRKILESEIWNKPPLYLKVWIFLLMKAQHRNFKHLQRGQLVTSIAEIQQYCSWKVGYRTEKPSKDQIYQVLNWMRSFHSTLRNEDEQGNEADTKATMITTMKATHGLLIKIENYDLYQDPANYESNSEHNREAETNANREQQPSNNINKNDKNEKNDKKNKKKDLRQDHSNQNETLTSTQEVADFVETQLAFNPLSVPIRLLISYIDTLRLTRKTACISINVIKRLWDKWMKFPSIVLTYAMWLHVEKHDDKREEYTLGIMRKTDEHEANRKLIWLKNRDRSNEREGMMDDTYPASSGSDPLGKWESFVIR
jgi:hypothetical protein